MDPAMRRPVLAVRARLLPFVIGVAALLALPVALPVAQATAQTASGGTSVAAGNVLERRAGLRAHGLPLSDALTRLQERAAVQIAYSPSLVSGMMVSCSCANITVREALDQMLAGTELRYSAYREGLLIEPDPAAQGVVEGRVVAANTRVGIEGVEVRLAGTELRVFTSPAGDFTMRGVPAGSYTLEARMLGYHQASRQVEVAAGGRVHVELELQTAALAVEGVLVAVQRTRTATKTNEPLLLIPQSVTVVPEVVVEQQQAQELAQVLRNVSGVSHTGTFQGVAADFHIRGFLAGPRGNYRRNGVEVFGLGDLMNANVESVEVLKGPASVLYGSVEPGGLINVVTKQPAPQAAYRGEVRAGSHGLINPRVDFTGPLNADRTLLYRLNTSWERSDSFRDVVSSESFFVSPVLSWRPGGRTEWTLEAELKHDDRNTDPGIAGVSDDWAGVDAVPLGTYLGEDEATYRWRQRAAMSTLEHQLSPEWRLRNVLHMASYDSDQYIFALGNRNGGGEVNRAAYYEEQGYRYAFAELNVQGVARTGPVTHRLVFGGDYQRVGADLGADAGSADPIAILNPVRTGAPPRSALETVWAAEQTNHTAGLFAQNQLEIGDRLRLLTGVRYTHLVQYSTDLLWGDGEDRFDEGVATPRVGALLRPQRNVSVYATYSRSFVPYYGFDREGQPFRPVTGQQVEGGVKADLFDDRLATGLAVYRLTRSNAVSFMFDSEFGFHGVQGARHRSTGVELDVLGRLTPEWTVMGSYAYIDGRILEDPNYEEGRKLSGAPPHSGSIWTSYELASGPGIGAGVFFTGERRTLNSSQVITPGYATVDVSATYRIADRYQARLNLRNAFNQRYYTGAQAYTLVFPGAPRSVQASVSARF